MLDKREIYRSKIRLSLNLKSKVVFESKIYYNKVSVTVFTSKSSSDFKNCLLKKANSLFHFQQNLDPLDSVFHFLLRILPKFLLRCRQHFGHCFSFLFHSIFSFLFWVGIIFPLSLRYVSCHCVQNVTIQEQKFDCIAPLSYQNVIEK